MNTGNWYDIHGISKLFLRNVIAFVIAALISSNAYTWRRLEVCQDRMTEKVETLKNEQLQTFRDFQNILTKQADLEKRLAEWEASAIKNKRKK